MKKALIVLGIILGVVIVAFAAKSVLSDKQEDAATGGPSEDASAIQPGKAFKLDGFGYGAGWSVGPDADGKLDVTGLKVKNNGDDQDDVEVVITLWMGDQALGTAKCTTDDIDPGKTATADCVSTDVFDGYDRITIDAP